MKVSIVLPVYNEPEFVKKAVESVYKQTFKKENMELIIIDDGSTDNTLSEVKGMLKGRKEIKVKVISTKNQGRSIAREKGVISASFNNILFLDARCILSDDFVEKLSKLKYQPIVPNPVINQETIYGRFGHLIRKRIYKGSYGNFKPYYITRSNYEKSGKGTGGLFIDKKLFLKSQIENKTSKDNSDDIKLLRNVVNRKKILKHPDLIIKYSPRSDIINHVSHTFLRGAKFVDYYSRPGTRFNLELILF
jgi:glycosyltransferase involved in cell wall biosynthesis